MQNGTNQLRFALVGLRSEYGKVPTRTCRLSDSLAELKTILNEPRLTAYLFGSRKDRTGSFRSDIDLLVPLNRRVSEAETNAIWDLEPYLDIFRLCRGVAESLINESQIVGKSDDELRARLEAVPLMIDGEWQPAADAVDAQTVLAERNPAATTVNLYNLIDAVPAERADVLVVTALAEEYLAVLDAFDAHATDGSTSLEVSDSSELPWLLRVVNLMEMGSVGAALKTYEALQRTKARHVVLVGLCAGVPERVDLLDVVLPTKVLFYEPGKIGPSGTEPSHETRECSESVLSVAATLNLVSEQGEPLNLICNQVVIGCGEKVVGSASFRLQLESANRKLVAIDMESYGVVRAAQSLRRETTVIKAVCDFADETKSDVNRTQARANAAQAFKALLKAGAFRG